MNRSFSTVGNDLILYDADRAGQITPDWFGVSYWPGAATSDGTAGRGKVLFIRDDARDWVLRHYYRGGKPAVLIRDLFVWLGPGAARPFREFDLLVRLVELGLPVPAPVAARCRRRGPFYTGDIITVRLPGVRSLADRIAAGDLGRADWARAGEAIAMFHARGVFHADLNVDNIQFDTDGAVWLLDFDRGRLLPGPGKWCRGNLVRLKRSLAKDARGRGGSADDAGWQALAEAYRRKLGAPYG